MTRETGHCGGQVAGHESSLAGTDTRSVEPDALFEPARHAYGVGWTQPSAAGSRETALAAVEAAGDDWDRAVIDQAIHFTLAAKGHGSANDVRPNLPHVRKSLIGARFLAAVKRGDLVRVGYVTSTDPATHARPIALYRFEGWTA